MGRNIAFGNFLGKASIPMLTLHSSLNIIFTHYVRRYNSTFLTSSAVFLSELFKFLLCFGILAVQHQSKIFDHLEIHFRRSQLGKLIIPAALFTLQNNLFYMANTNLDSITYQITYQFKIVTTAFFSYVILAKHFSKTQVFSLAVLLFGIVLIQIEDSAADLFSGKAKDNQLIGFGQVIVASISSGFTNVYLEKIYKSSDDTLLIKNLQLSLLSIPISIGNILIQDGATVSQRGLFYAYDVPVLTLVLFNALGGLIISLVLKHHDNITKIFSTSVSIILTFVLSVYLFDKRVNEYFMFGLIHVFVSIYLYYF
uniref:CMP-sialic acid transporter n=1 Tax=Cacopsylla melanoneura TaxID=428564 RepID=A0A8D8ZSQ5_9HEMI